MDAGDWDTAAAWEERAIMSADAIALLSDGCAGEPPWARALEVVGTRAPMR
jgi:hypothetical protein